jgi:GTP-binding protein
MVPADADDIVTEYKVLLNELQKFNPDMLDKGRVLAITKSDMLDDELIAEIKPTLPEGVPHVFISSLMEQGIMELKDILWKELNDDSNRLENGIVHQSKDLNKLSEELKVMGEDDDLSVDDNDNNDDDGFEFEYEEEPNQDV